MTVILDAASSNAYATNEKRIEMYPAMFNNYADLTPLTVISTRLGARKVYNSRIDWTEGEEIPRTVVVGTDGSATLTIANWSYTRIGDMLFVPRTKELIRVSATPTTSAVTVVRGIGATPEATILPTDTVQIISPSTVEGSDQSSARQVTNTNAYNYTQIINHFIHTTKTANEEKTFFGPKREENQAKMWRDYRIKFEMALMFSYISATADPASTAYNYRTMGGLIEKLATGTNVYTVPGVLTETGFDNWLVDVYTAMADSRDYILFGSPKLISIITQFGKPLIRISPNTTKYGLWLQQYMGAVNVDLVRCPLLSGDDTLAGWGFLLDMSRVKLAYLRKPVLLKNTWPERAEYIEDKIESEVSLIVASEKAHGFIEGVTG